jgi:hypothetical protein
MYPSAGRLTLPGLLYFIWIAVFSERCGANPSSEQDRAKYSNPGGVEHIWEVLRIGGAAAWAL